MNGELGVFYRLSLQDGSEVDISEETARELQEGWESYSLKPSATNGMVQFADIHGNAIFTVYWLFVMLVRSTPESRQAEWDRERVFETERRESSGWT